MSDQYKENILFTSKLSLGTKAKIIRIACKWRQTDLATMASVTQVSVSAFERDLPVYPSDEKKILQALDMVPDGIKFYKERMLQNKSNCKLMRHYEKRLSNLEEALQ